MCAWPGMEDVEADAAGLEREPVRHESRGRVRLGRRRRVARAPGSRRRSAMRPGCSSAIRARRRLVRDDRRRPAPRSRPAPSAWSVWWCVRTTCVTGSPCARASSASSAAACTRRDERVHDDDRALAEEHRRVRAVALASVSPPWVKTETASERRSRLRATSRSGLYTAQRLRARRERLLHDRRRPVPARSPAPSSRGAWRPRRRPSRAPLPPTTTRTGNPMRSMSLNFTPGRSSRSS